MNKSKRSQHIIRFLLDIINQSLLKPYYRQSSFMKQQRTELRSTALPQYHELI